MKKKNKTKESKVDKETTPDLDQDEQTPSQTLEGADSIYIKELEETLTKKNQKITELISHCEQASLNIETAKQRIRKEVFKEAEQEKRAIIVEFLDIIDNLDRALDAASKSEGASTLIDGVIMVRDLFVGKLRTLGVHRVEALGTAFDPNKHEALTIVPTGDPQNDGQIMAIVKNGYMIGDEVLRPASVAVGGSTSK